MCRTRGDPFYLYAPDGPVASWLSAEWRAMQEHSLPPDVFQRLIENKWVEGAGSFITRAQLQQCVDPNLSPRLTGEHNTQYAVGLDLGLKRDRTALAVAHLDSAKDAVVLDSLRVWQGSRNAPVQIGAVEEELLSLGQRFHVRTFTCDPWQLQGTIQRLSPRLPVKEFNFTAQSVRRLSETLFTLIQSGRLRLFPDTELERELLNLNVVQKGYGWRIDHASGRYSDRAMALGMACMEVLAMPRGHPNVRWLYS